MTTNRTTAREQFIQWQDAGNEPKRRHTALQLVSEFTGIPYTTFNSLCSDVRVDPATGKSKIDDGLAFLYWDIKENGGRIIGPASKEAHKAKALYILQVARGIVAGKRYEIKHLKVAGGGFAKVSQSIYVRHQGFKSISDMKPAQLLSAAKRRLDDIKHYLATWKAINSSPEYVIEAARMLRQIAEEWEATIMPPPNAAQAERRVA